MEENRAQTPGFAYYHIGASKTRSYEDRHFLGTVTTRSSMKLVLAIVSDGVGGGNLGQLAADLTISTIVEHIQNSNLAENEIPKMLGAAIGAANKSVYQESRKDKSKDGMSATVSIAVVHNNKLYVANVGDSRIYLLRSGRATQITVDHTFAYDKIKQGVLTPEKAHSHPSADAITRSVGFEENILVDLGLYLEGGKEDGKQAFANQGLPMSKDDVILVCSDGLIKSIANDKKRHYVEEDEIVNILKQYHAEEAAKVMVDLAVGRNVDDNVTAVVVEFPGRKLIGIRKRKIIWGVVSAVLLLLLVVAGLLLIRAMNELGEISQASLDQTETSSAFTATAASFTPTPSPTMRPTLVPGEIGAIFRDGIRIPFMINSPVEASEFTEISINHTGEFEDGMIYLFELSKILFEAPPSETMNFVIFPGSQLLVYPGRYLGGSGIRIAGAKGIVDFSSTGPCMALDYKNDEVISTCFEGDCFYQIDYGEKINIQAGTFLVMDINTLLSDEGGPIPSSQVFDWLAVIPGRSPVRQCVARWLPTAVPTQKSPDNSDRNTNPIATPTTLPTDTPAAPPTRTSRRPTDTPEPPPTNTPEPPPTNTPEPPPTDPPAPSDTPG